jgi:nucleotide-binding universal stress UspA family protein
MKRMGEFLLSMAQERAEAQGVWAQARIRCGKVQRELIPAVQREAADMLVLGRPSGEDSTFRLATLERLAAEIEKVCEVRVVIV